LIHTTNRYLLPARLNTTRPSIELGRMIAARIEQLIQPNAQQQGAVRPKLAAFYALLNDEQQAKFNTIGPAPQSANPQGPSQSGGWRAGITDQLLFK
jgi:LTXXQ motif family protein